MAWSLPDVRLPSTALKPARGFQFGTAAFGPGRSNCSSFGLGTAFNVEVARILADRERQQLRAIVEYLKPAHTHFVDLVEPLPPILPDHGELGLSDLGETTDLH